MGNIGIYFNLPRWLECGKPLESLSGELDFGARFPTTNVNICFQQFFVFKKWWAKVEHRNTIKHGFEAPILMSATSRAIIDKDIDENGDFQGGPPLCRWECWGSGQTLWFEMEYLNQ